MMVANSSFENAQGQCADGAAGAILVDEYSLEAWPGFAALWADLAADSNASIFLSNGWMETWFESFREFVRPSLLIFRCGQERVAACVVTRPAPSLKRPLSRLCLNASGEPSTDTTYVEFNSVPCRAGWEVQVGTALGQYALRHDWDELRLDGFCSGPLYTAFRKSLQGLREHEARHSSYYVDLAHLRAAGLSYRDFLGARHRKHLNQNLRNYAQSGDLAVRAAGSPAEALGMFEQLAGLSRTRWKHGGMFASERFAGFHRNFVRKTFCAGNVQLLHVSAGPVTIGLLYNLVLRGKVYFYQCGYNYSGDKRSPGTVTLALSIQYCLDQGFSEFDFLSGSAPYKVWMASGSRELVWCSYQRPSPKVWAYDLIRGFKIRRKGRSRG